MKTLALRFAVIAGSAICAHAQQPITASDPAVARYDGVYQFISAKWVAESTMTTWQRMRSCSQSPIEGPLTIVNGQATYSYSGRDRRFQGTVGSGGRLRMGTGRFTDSDFTTQSAIDDSGTIRARQTGYRCTFDLIWQNAPR